MTLFSIIHRNFNKAWTKDTWVNWIFRKHRLIWDITNLLSNLNVQTFSHDNYFATKPSSIARPRIFAS